MTVQPIRLAGASILNVRTRFTDPLSEQALACAQDLTDTLRAMPEAVALAANQIGYNERMYAYRDRDEGIVVLVNPAFVPLGRRMQFGREGCMSFPGQTFMVRRHHAVAVLSNKSLEWVRRTEAYGYQARMHQHEIDHLNGVLITQRAVNHPKGRT